METETQYDLTTSFDYGYQGEQLTASHLILHQPNATQLGECGKIRKWMNTALRQNRELLGEEDSARVDAAEARAADDDSEDQEEEVIDEAVDAGSVIALMARADIPLDQFYLTTQKILQGPGIVTVDGVTKMTPPLWKKLSAHDMELIVGQYIGVFFLR